MIYVWKGKETVVGPLDTHVVKKKDGTFAQKSYTNYDEKLLNSFEFVRLWTSSYNYGAAWLCIASTMG